MILHFFPNEKFTVDYITKVNSLFPMDEHNFFVYNNHADICDKEKLRFDNVYFGELEKDDERFNEWMSHAERIVLHGVWFTTKALILFCNKQREKAIPMVWTVWGGDFYNAYRDAKGSLNIRKRIRESYRKKLIKSLYGINSSSDYDSICKLYKTNAKLFKAPYAYQFIEVKNIENNDGIMNVMVGHSATETCRHIETFEKLAPLAGKIRVYCPLSYPDDKEYISKVTESGKSIFGDKFIPMTDFMKYDDYVNFLNSIDIGVLNNDRQQGNGNVTNLLYLGKKLYMSKENTLFNTYSNLGADVSDFEKMDINTFLEPLGEDVRKKNREVIEYRYSDENFHNTWNKVFYE